MLITPAAFVIGLIMGTYIKPFLNFFRNIDADFESDVEVLDLLSAAIVDNGVDRALLLVATNGGENIKLGSHKYASILLEPANSLKPYSKPMFQKYSLDEEYIRMLAKVKNDGHVVLLTQDMPEGILKRRFNADKITCGLIFLVKSTATQFFYLSFSTKDPMLTMLDRHGPHYADIEAKVNTIRNLF